MSAGQPNWSQLNAMGKLPKEQRGQIPLLQQLDAAEAVIEEYKEGCCEECRAKFFGGSKPAKKQEAPVNEGQPVTLKCEHPGCDYETSAPSEGLARNNIRMHGRTHEVKEADQKTPEKEEVIATP